MNRKQILWTSVISAVGFAVLILDAKTALIGASEGITLCLYTVVPSLFPFFVVSSILNSSLLQSRITLLRPIGRLCGIPKGAESLLLLGLLGGYPVGAQCIYEAYRSGTVSQNTAKRMLGFCNNAGPAFLFGMVGCLFEEPYVIWILWGIHILSALLTGMIIPHKTEESVILGKREPITLFQSVSNSIRIIAQVCAWVILFRVLIAFIERWFVWMLPNEIQAFISGILELSNGIHQLNYVIIQGCRFVLSAIMLSFGGICVAMQTASVTAELGVGLYFPGKAIQVSISFILSALFQYIIFPADECWKIPIHITLTIILISIPAVISIFKNYSRNFRTSVV